MSSQTNLGVILSVAGRTKWPIGLVDSRRQEAYIGQVYVWTRPLVRAEKKSWLRSLKSNESRLKQRWSLAGFTKSGTRQIFCGSVFGQIGTIGRTVRLRPVTDGNRWTSNGEQPSAYYAALGLFFYKKKRCIATVHVEKDILTTPGRTREGIGKWYKRSLKNDVLNSLLVAQQQLKHSHGKNLFFFSC